MPIAKLNRSLLRLSGENVETWLKGLITNSLHDKISFAALLTPQGKIIADFFITRDGNDLLLDTPQKFGAALHKRLKMYKLREAIDVTDETDSLHVYAVWKSDENGGTGEIGRADPRLPALGFRLITSDELDTTGDYNAHRLSLGIPDSTWDFESQTTFPADANMDLINGVDFKKGCFVGQEVVSRMKRMTTVKKRFRGIILTHAATAGDKIMAGERVIGEVLSVHNNMGMALIRLDRWNSATTEPTVNGHTIQIMGSPDGRR